MAFLMVFAPLSALVSAVQLSRPALVHKHVTPAMSSGPGPLDRRTMLAAVAAAAVTPLQPALADDPGAWTSHVGAFDDNFFKDFTSSNGFLYKKVFIPSPETEKPVPFQKVRVEYTGYLLDGTKFDTSYGKGGPFAFRLGKGKVITGWESIVGGMTVGMKVIVKIPPEFAYGDEGAGVIPPKAPLIFYMELVELGNIKGDKPRLGGILA